MSKVFHKESAEVLAASDKGSYFEQDKLLELDGLDKEEDEAVCVFSASHLKLKESIKRIHKRQKQKSLSQMSQNHNIWTRPILYPKLHMHFAEILSSLLILYSNNTTRTRKRNVLTLILSFPKAWCLSQIHCLNSCYFLHRTLRLLSFDIPHRKGIAPSASLSPI